MNGNFNKITSIALILAMLLTQLCFAVIGAEAASSSEGETVYFKSITKNTFVQYLNEVRLENALRDITENKVSVTNAALNNGFANVKSFIRMCKSVYNCTPTGYKIKYKNNIK